MKTGTPADRAIVADHARELRRQGKSTLEVAQFIENRLARMTRARRAYSAAMVEHSILKPVDALHCPVTFTAEQLCSAYGSLVAMKDGI